MKKFILPAAMMALFISGQAFAGDFGDGSVFDCSVDIEYKGASASAAETSHHPKKAKKAAKASACSILCKGAEACIDDCIASAEYKGIRCKKDGEDFQFKHKDGKHKDGKGGSCKKDK